METLDLNQLASLFNKENYAKLKQEMSFADYLTLCQQKPKTIRTSFQRILDMILLPGTQTYKECHKTYTVYNFFNDKEYPIFGLEPTLDAFVKHIRAAAGSFGTEKRFLLLHGPVGSSKSTILRLVKSGMERDSRTDHGAWYSYKWVNLPESVYLASEDDCPMHDEPLRLLPVDIRNKFISLLNRVYLEQTPEEDRSSLYKLFVEGDLNPRCQFYMDSLLKIYQGDLFKVLDSHIRVVREVYSENNRKGIATFQPKDEKNQDATELTGDIDYRKISEYGSDSDPRAFTFDGEFCCSNRGMMEFVEVLKLDKEFLYDLLTASQEKRIKPKKFAQIPIDAFLIGHTNNPEFEKLKNDKTMEALRDRTVKIDVPYLTKISKEVQVLKHSYNKDRLNQHIAPHTMEMVATWLVLTRLQDDRENQLSLMEKAKLYDDKYINGYNAERVKELQDKYPEEGMYGGVSVRYAQDKIALTLSEHKDYINVFLVLNAIREGLINSPLITNKDEIQKYVTACELVIKEYEDIAKKEVQQAVVGDEQAIVNLCDNYIRNVVAFINKSKVVDSFTGKEMAPNEQLMLSIESKMRIPEKMAEDFRREITSFMGTLAAQKIEFTWKSNDKLRQGLEAKLFEDTKDYINFSTIGSNGSSVISKEQQQKVDALKERMKSMFGYNDQSSTDVLNFVAGIFARGDKNNNS